MYVCVFMYLLIYVCMHVRRYVCLCTYVFMYVFKYACMYVNMCVCMYMYVCTYVCMHALIYVCMFIRMCVVSYAHMYYERVCARACVRVACARARVCVCVCVCVCARVYGGSATNSFPLRGLLFRFGQTKNDKPSDALNKFIDYKLCIF